MTNEVHAFNDCLAVLHAYSPEDADRLGAAFDTQKDAASRKEIWEDLIEQMREHDDFAADTIVNIFYGIY